MSNLVERARGIAIGAHAGQTDKAGYPYWQHPYRVAKNVASDEAKAVAWLHDVLEDTDVTEQDLVYAGAIPQRVVNAVVALTRLAGESSDTYYARVKTDSLALEVKRADIADNMDEARTSRLDQETRARLRRKYEHALEVLNG